MSSRVDVDSDSVRLSVGSTCDAVVEGGSLARDEGVDMGSGSSIGSRLVSLIEMTIFSRSRGVRCFALPRLMVPTDSLRRNSGRALGMQGADCDV